MEVLCISRQQCRDFHIGYIAVKKYTSNIILACAIYQHCAKKCFFLYEDLQNQRQFFFDAASVYQAVRDAFQDGDQEFDILKKEAYEGIRETYIGQYSDGFERLRQVLIKITNTSFQRTELVKITHLIGNSEKKGICHMLVEDKRIRSWVNRF